MVPVSLAFLVLVGVITAQADLYPSHGQDTFTVRIINRHLKPIYDARGMVWGSGNSTRIEVAAPGYGSGITTIFMNPNANYYYATVTLDNPSVWVAAKPPRAIYFEDANSRSWQNG